MNDRETVKAMLRRAGIEFEESGDEIKVERGYPDFYVCFRFKDGALDDLAAFE